MGPPKAEPLTAECCLLDHDSPSSPAVHAVSISARSRAILIKTITFIGQCITYLHICDVNAMCSAGAQAVTMSVRVCLSLCLFSANCEVKELFLAPKGAQEMQYLPAVIRIKSRPIRHLISAVAAISLSKKRTSSRSTSRSYSTHNCWGNSVCNNRLLASAQF